MKKFLFLAAIAVLALGACSKNEIAKDTNPDNVVSFTTYAGRTLTKANSTLINGGDFSTSTNPNIGVFAWLKATGAFQGNESDLMMNNVKVTLQDGGNTASDTYSNLQYWPKDVASVPGNYKNTISFAAYYPYGDEHITATPATGLGAYNFTVDEDVSKHTDFMVSDVVPNLIKAQSDAGSVPFRFRHMLTKVQFYVKQAASYTGTTIKVTSIKLAGVKTKGTLTTNYNPDTGGTGFNWGGLSTAQTYEFINTFKNLTTTPAKVADDDDDYTYLMIPQNLGNDVTITFKYTVTPSEGVPVNETVTFKLNEAKVSGTPLTQWEQNQNIKYTFTVALDVITFKAEAVAWEDEKNAGLTITD
jgi:hypothetical protein